MKSPSEIDPQPMACPVHTVYEVSKLWSAGSNPRERKQNCIILDFYFDLAVTVMSTVFWVVMSCNLESTHRFTRTLKLV
jgi:hypothetical protein